MSSSTTSYTSQVCNDSAQVEQRCNPAAKSCTKSCNAQNQCTCTGDADCGGAVGSCAAGVCTGSVCPAQCAKTCNGSGECTCSNDSDCSPGFGCTGGICVGNGPWPTGSIGSFGSGDQCYVDYGSGVHGHDFSGNVQEWTSTNVVVQSGSGATVTAASGGQATVSGLANILDSYAGAQLVLSGSTKGNNGTYDIASVQSSTQVTITTSTTKAEGGLGWQVVYNKIRGGNYDTTGSTGDSCEFDFDIQKESFANSDVGFRCCSDALP
jgi:hypothetical protein